MMHFARASKFFASCSVHQSVWLPFASNLRPELSKPCVISCPMTAPMPP